MQVCSKGKGKGAGPTFPAHLQILTFEFLSEEKQSQSTRFQCNSPYLSSGHMYLMAL